MLDNILSALCPVYSTSFLYLFLNGISQWCQTYMAQGRDSAFTSFNFKQNCSYVASLKIVLTMREIIIAVQQCAFSTHIIIITAWHFTTELNFEVHQA